jgi:hypothetical protein
MINLLYNILLVFPETCGIFPENPAVKTLKKL